MSVVHEEILEEQESLIRSLQSSEPEMERNIASLRAIRMLLVNERLMFEGEQK